MKMVFELALDLCEKRPGASFVMSRSTAWGYHIVEKKHPALFRRVQEAVAEGRIELSGGQWVEPDNLVPSGESHVRQGLYAQRYFLSRFGRTATVAWDPDVFGHGNTLPQIFRHVGLEGYYFHRMLPTDDSGSPIGKFVWQGPDGAQVLCFAGNWSGKPDVESIRELLDDAAGPEIGFEAVVTGRNSDRRMTITNDWLDLPERLRESLDLSECRWAGSAEALEVMQEKRGLLPVVKGDLGGYSYTGTYTSDSVTKRFNRRLENRLAAAELLDVWVERLTGLTSAHILGEAWRNLCVNQFHDIICGTCYKTAQEEAHALYRTIDATAADVLRRAGEVIAGSVATNEQPGTPFIVFNTAPSPRTEPLELVVPSIGHAPAGPVRIVTAAGDEVPSHAVPGVADCEDRTLRGGTGDAAAGPSGRVLRMLPDGIPAYGYRVFYLQEADRWTDVRDDELVLENALVRVEVDRSYGSITSLFDKRTGTEYVKPGGRFDRIVTYEDANDYRSPADHRWDAWYIRLTGRQYDPHGAYSVSVVESSSVQKTIRVTRSFSADAHRPNTVLIQDISLSPGSPLVRIHMHGDWQAQEAIVKAEFDFAYRYDTVICEMPYGVIERSSVIDTVRTVGAEAAEDRVRKGSERDEPDRPMQNWLDVSDGTNGLAILNNGKYGYDSAPDSIRLSLMRAPNMREGEIAGLGPFEFSYALLPHPGSWAEANVAGAALAFNRDPVVQFSWAHDGVLPSAGELFSVTDPAVHITVVKRAECSAAVVLRLYESSGTAREARVESRYRINRVFETNALELTDGAPEIPVSETSADISADTSAIDVSLGGHQIKTLVLELGE
jgi:alpha-mannosidase